MAWLSKNALLVTVRVAPARKPRFAMAPPEPLLLAEDPTLPPRARLAVKMLLAMAAVP
jgi:hypothetical protein